MIILRSEIIGVNNMLKNILIFIAGMVTMFILMVLFGITVNSSSNNGYPGLTIFEEEGKCMGAKQIEIMQTIEPNMALAHAKTLIYLEECVLNKLVDINMKQKWV